MNTRLLLSTALVALALGAACHAQTVVRGRIYTDAGQAAVVTTPSAGVGDIMLSQHGKFKAHIDKDSTAIIIFAWPGYTTKVLHVSAINRHAIVDVYMERGDERIVRTLTMDQFGNVNIL